ncbi:hypothetical protein ACGFX4_17980 [Kitasatospora sp. NPDC048365]|uniref:hypothetical protein n=1 Tax=Kitasatospora sp. NPDC048365 TaxID=3364050 RepID=UPI003715045F
MKIIRDLALLSVAVVLVCAGGYWVFGRGDCTGADDRLGERLARESVLAAPGDGLRRVDLTVYPCDEDDAHVELSAGYRVDGTGAETRYRAALVREGWRPLDLEWPTRHCWVKDTAGTTAYLRLRPVSEAEVAVVVRATRGGGDWC